MALALAMVGTAVPQGSGVTGLFASSDISVSAYEEGDFSYTQLLEDTCKITRYNGQSTNLEIPETLGGLTVTGIDDNAFSNNKKLEHIVLPETLVTIGSCAFANCYALEEIILPDSVTSIAYSAFDQCHGLKSIKIGKGLHFLPLSAFNNTGVINLTIPKNIQTIGMGDRTVFANCQNLKTVLVEGTPDIGEEAFYYCQSLETVVLESGVSSIGKYAFQSCTKLKTVTIPSTVARIGEKAFDSTGDDLTIIYDGTQAQWNNINGKDNVPTTAKIVFASETGVRLYGYSLSLLEDNNIGVNFYMQVPEGLSSKAKMHFTIPSGKEVIEEDVLVSKAGEKPVGDENYKVFKCSVAAKEMTSRITAQIIDEATNFAGPVYVYSVKEYADYLLDHQSVDAYKKAAPLVKSMLNYGAYSQIYFNKNTSDLANIGLTEADKDVSGVTAAQINKPYSDNNMIVTIGFTETKFEKVALSLKSQTELVMYFKNPDYDLTFECKDGNAVEKTTTKDGYQVAHIKGIRADELGETYTLNLYDGEQILGTVEYCPLSYCYYVVLEERGTEELQNVCKALFLFNQQAVAYNG